MSLSRPLFSFQSSMPRLSKGASCHRPCGGCLRGGGLFISVPFAVVCLMALTIHAIQSDSKPRQHRHHINHCKHYRPSACRNRTTATQKPRRHVTATARRVGRPGRDATATATTDGHDVNTIAPAQIPHDTPKHNRTTTPMLHTQHFNPRTP